MALSDLAELEALLADRDVSMQVHQAGEGWVVWIYAPEDPAVLATGEDTDLGKAFEAALGAWDGASSEGGEGQDGSPAGGGADPTEQPS